MSYLDEAVPVTAEEADAICVECLAPAMLGSDCICGSGYVMPVTATIAELLEARAWAANDNDPTQ